MAQPFWRLACAEGEGKRGRGQRRRGGSFLRRKGRFCGSRHAWGEQWYRERKVRHWLWGRCRGTETEDHRGGVWIHHYIPDIQRGQHRSRPSLFLCVPAAGAFGVWRLVQRQGWSAGAGRFRKKYGSDRALLWTLRFLYGKKPSSADRQADQGGKMADAAYPSGMSYRRWQRTYSFCRGGCRVLKSDGWRYICRDGERALCCRCDYGAFRSPRDCPGALPAKYGKTEILYAASVEPCRGTGWHVWGDGIKEPGRKRNVWVRIKLWLLFLSVQDTIKRTAEVKNRTELLI